MAARRRHVSSPLVGLLRLLVVAAVAAASTIMLGAVAAPIVSAAPTPRQ